MTTLSVIDLARDQSLQPLLSRYRDEACREVMAERRPRLLRIVRQIAEVTSEMDLNDMGLERGAP